MKKFTLFKSLMLTIACIVAGGVQAETYYTGFEDVTKSSYASADVLTGSPLQLTWNMTDAMAGGDASDFFIDTKSIRMRGYATSKIEMKDAKTGGIGTISFKYRRYGSDAQIEWKVQWSSDGTTWNDINTFTATAEEATYSYDLNNADATLIRIIANIETGSSNRRMNIDELTITDWPVVLDKVGTPSFNPGGGKVVDKVDVTITCGTEDATIYYTIDGTDPSTASAAYTAPFEVTSTTTVKAFAVKSGMSDSNIGTVTYTFPENVADIAGFLAINEDDFAKITGPVTAIFQNGSSLYTKDASGYLLVYGSLGKNYQNGDKLTGIAGTKDMYGVVPELIPFGTFPDGVAGTAVEPEVVTTSQLSTADISKYIKLEDVEFVADVDFVTTATVNGEIKDGEDGTIVVRATFRNFEASFKAGDHVDIVGFITVYNDAVQIYPVSIVLHDNGNVKGNTIDDRQLRTQAGNIILNAKAGEIIRVYNVTGQMIGVQRAIEGTNFVPIRAHGVVIVQAGNFAGKVIVK